MYNSADLSKEKKSTPAKPKRLWRPGPSKPKKRSSSDQRKPLEPAENLSARFRGGRANAKHDQALFLATWSFLDDMEVRRSRG